MLIDLGDDLRKAEMKDARQLADITADAFAEDPVMNWMFGNPRAIQSAFRVLAPSSYIPLDACYLHSDNGATMWVPWEQETKPTTFDMLKFAIGQTIHGSQGALRRAIGAAEIMQKHHPEDRHWYLFTIGSTQAARGKGVGKALLKPVLEACDRESMPVYLENSNPHNTGFYRAHGFERSGELFYPGEGSPPMEPMWREPKAV